MCLETAFDVHSIILFIYVDTFNTRIEILKLDHNAGKIDLQNSDVWFDF